jgi:hypothetical protein
VTACRRAATVKQGCSEGGGGERDGENIFMCPSSREDKVEAVHVVGGRSLQCQRSATVVAQRG